MATPTQQHVDLPKFAGHHFMTDPPPSKTTIADRDGSESHVDLHMPADTLRIGAVAYLNTKPLIYGLESAVADFGSLQLALPSRLASALHRGELDVGLIPVVEYLRHRSQYRIVSNAAIACRGPVWSVRVLFRREPRDVRTLAVDEGSRSSVALTSILYQSRYGRIPHLVDFPIDAQPEDSKADAVLVIGDRAMRPERYQGTFLTDWDLGV